MFWLVATVLLGIVAVGAIIVATIPSPDGQRSNRGTAILVAGGCALVWIVLTAFLSIHTVGQRQVGIVYNFSGTIAGKTDPGVVMTAPWQHVKRENVGLQREDFDLDASNAAVSQDQQSIYARLTVNYQVEPAKVVDLFKTVGPAWKATLLDSRVLQVFKEVTSHYTAAQITISRVGLRNDTVSRLRTEMARYDIRIVDVFVKNIDYTDSYKKAISAKNVQVQRALQAEAKERQATAEGQQVLNRAKKEAEANRLLAKSITAPLIQLRSIEKLNPNVEVIYVPAGASFLLQTAKAAK